MCGHYSVEWYTHGTLLLGATHLSLILYYMELKTDLLDTDLIECVVQL